MCIKDYVLKMSLQRFFLSLLVLAVLSVLGSEWLFTQRIFSTLNQSIHYFEKTARADDDDVSNHLREVNEEMEYDNAMSICRAAEWTALTAPTEQEKDCAQWENISRYQSMLKLAFVKQQAFLTEELEHRLKKNQESIKQAIAQHQFDPKICKQRVE